MRQPNEITLRRVEPEDESVIAKWLQDPRDCEFAIGHFPFTHEDFQQWMSADDQFGWVLEGESGLIAYGEVWVDNEAKDVELAHLIVAPALRGHGFGRYLTARLYEKACEFGFPWVYMRVVPENHAAVACYQSVEFKEMASPSPDMPTNWLWLRRACET